MAYGYISGLQAEWMEERGLIVGAVEIETGHSFRLETIAWEVYLN